MDDTSPDHDGAVVRELYECTRLARPGEQPGLVRPAPEPAGDEPLPARAKKAEWDPEPPETGCAEERRLLMMKDAEFLKACPDFDPDAETNEAGMGMWWAVCINGKYHVLQLPFEMYNPLLPANIYNQAAIAKLESEAKDKEIAKLKADLVAAAEASTRSLVVLAQIDSVCGEWDAPGTPVSGARDAICQVARILFRNGLAGCAMPGEKPSYFRYLGL
jgi:hypothetical protein